jgi:hypothetical protein
MRPGINFDQDKGFIFSSRLPKCSDHPIASYLINGTGFPPYKSDEMWSYPFASI